MFIRRLSFRHGSHPLWDWKGVVFAGLLFVILGPTFVQRSFGYSLPLSILVSVAAAVVFVGFYACLTLFPQMVYGKQVVVSSEGIKIWPIALPADRIAEVVQIDAEQMAFWKRKRFLMATRAGRWQVEDRYVAAFRFLYPWEQTMPAVMVRDREGGDRPWWLFGIPDHVGPEKFAAAVRSIATDLEGSDHDG